MRLKKGDKVEVMNKNDYISGDVVEVFYEYTWRTATILKVWESKRGIKSKKVFVQGAVVHKQFLVRLHGCSQKLIVQESNIRIKETWRDDKWILSGKISRGVEDVTASKPSTSICYQEKNFQIPQINPMVKNQPRKDSMNILDETIFPESHNYSRSLKRMSTSFNECNGHTRKLRAIEKDGWKQRLAVGPVLEKNPCTTSSSWLLIWDLQKLSATSAQSNNVLEWPQLEAYVSFASKA
ncbi:hypothetical protein ACS0TY_012162 [Phlomoides rotata]